MINKTRSVAMEKVWRSHQLWDARKKGNPPSVTKFKCNVTLHLHLSRSLCARFVVCWCNERHCLFHAIRSTDHRRVLSLPMIAATLLIIHPVYILLLKRISFKLGRFPKVLNLFLGNSNYVFSRWCDLGRMSSISLATHMMGKGEILFPATSTSFSLLLVLVQHVPGSCLLSSCVYIAFHATWEVKFSASPLKHLGIHLLRFPCVMFAVSITLCCSVDITICVLQSDGNLGHPTHTRTRDMCQMQASSRVVRCQI